MVKGKHQEDTMPANFAHILKENYQQGLGERNSSHGKFNEISSHFMGVKFSPPQINAHFPVQGISDPQQYSSVSSQIPSYP